jgi:hypothetical protein
MKMYDIGHIASLIDAGQPIQAIKEFRRITGWGLYDSKTFVRPLATSTGDEFRRKAIAEFINSPGDLLAEFAVHVRKLEAVIAQFAELMDSQEATA